MNIEYGISEEQSNHFNLKGGKKMDNWTLKDYQPEKVTDSFEMMKGKGHVCQVNSALIEDVIAGVSERDGKAYEGYKRFKYEIEVVSDTYKTRRAWKSFNLDSIEARGAEGKEKTPREKLADVMFTVGLEFKTIEELQAILGKFANMKLVVSFSSIPAERSQSGDAIQLHRIVGEAKEGDNTAKDPAF